MNGSKAKFYLYRIIILVVVLGLYSCAEQPNPEDDLDPSWGSSASGLFDKKAYPEALVLLEGAVNHPIVIGNPVSLGWGRYMMGLIYYTQNEKQEALIQYYLALEAYEKVNEANTLGGLLNNIGHIYKEHKESEKALEYYQKAYEALKNDTTQAITVLSNMGEAYQQMNNYDSALTHFQKALALDTKSVRHGLRIDIAVIYQLKEDYQAAHENYEKALEFFEKRNDEQKMAMVFNNMALVYRDEGKKVKAIDYFKRSISLKEKHGISTLTSTYNNIAELYREQKKPEVAKSYLSRALASEINDNKEHMSSLDLMADILEDQGLFKLSNAYLKKSKKVREAIFEERLKVNIFEIKNQIIIDRVDDRMRLLRMEKEKTKMSASIQDMNETIKWGLLISSVVLIALFIFVVLYKKIRKLNMALNAFTENTSHSIRNQLAGITGSTYLLKNHSSALNSDDLESVKTIENISHSMEGLLTNLLETKDVTKVILTFHCPDATVEKMVQIYQPQAEAKHIRLEKVIETEDSIRIDAETYEHAVGNLVNNAIKYSPKGSTVTIRLFEEGNRLILAVIDEGKGIHENQYKKLFKKRVKLHRRQGLVSSGLGLYYAKKNIVSIGGEIWHENRAEGGSAFMIAFNRV